MVGFIIGLVLSSYFYPVIQSEIIYQTQACQTPYFEVFWSPHNGSWNCHAAHYMVFLIDGAVRQLLALYKEEFG